MVADAEGLVALVVVRFIEAVEDWLEFAAREPGVPVRADPA